MLRIPLALVVAILVIAAPASAQSPADPPQVTSDGLRMNLQAADLTIQFAAQFPGGPPDSWTASVIRPARRDTADQLGWPDTELARGSGFGGPGEYALPVTDPEWRWRFIATLDQEVFLRWTWTEGGETFSTSQLVFLSMWTNTGKSAGQPRVGPGFAEIPGSVPIFMPRDPDEILIAPPEPEFVAIGRAVSDGLGASSFRSGRKLRTSVQVPWTLPPGLAKTLKVKVKYPRGRNPGFGIPVYTATVSPPATAGAQAPVKAKLTPRGRTLVKQLGAKKVAARMASAGAVEFWWQPIRLQAPRTLYTPIGTCFHDYQRPARSPCSQTCEAFPGIPKGYLMYTVHEHVYGSDTCRKGDPLPPVVFV
jgi:hypothetical protein